MDLVLACIARLLTLINPCVLPVLPIVLAFAPQPHRLGPVAMGGMALGFVTLELTVTAFGQAIGLDARNLGWAGAIITAYGTGVATVVGSLG
jgi:cytochrome c-type biogenesis protein